MTDSTVAPVLSSIRNRAVIVSLVFNKPKLSAKDAKASTDAALANNADASVLDTNRKLYPKPLIAPILAVEAEARNYLRARSSMALVDGVFIVNTGLLMEVLPALNEFEVKRQQAVTVFAQNWSNVLANAQASQGGLYDATQYPDVSEVVSQFKMSIRTLPVGDLGGGLFDDIESELREQVTEQVEQTTKHIMAGAVSEPLERLIESVINMYDKTSRDNSRVHDSLVRSLKDVADRMPALNVLGLTQLNDLAAHCSRTFDVPVEALKRKDSAIREQTANNAKEVLAACGVDPTRAQGATTQEMRELAATAASDILAQMDGMF